MKRYFEPCLKFISNVPSNLTKFCCTGPGGVLILDCVILVTSMRTVRITRFVLNPYFHLVHRRLEYSRPKKMVKNLHLDWGEYGYRLPRAETLACRTATRRRPQTNSLN